MPAPKQGEAFVLKHRLAGAGVLIAFAVIVLPLLLGGPREEANGRDAEPAASREPDTKVFRSNITPIGGATPGAEARNQPDLERTVGELLNPDTPPDGGPTERAQAGAAENEADRSAQAARSDEPDGAADGVATQTASRSDDGGAAAPEEPAATPSEIERGWIVQVGTFAKTGNARKLVDDLENGGFGASTTEVETANGSATRVWIGPYGTRVEAARAKTRVSQRTGSEALIVAYP